MLRTVYTIATAVTHSLSGEAERQRKKEEEDGSQAFGKKTAPDTFFPRHLSRGERRPEEENTNILFFSVLYTFQVRGKREKSVSSSPYGTIVGVDFQL